MMMPNTQFLLLISFSETFWQYSLDFRNPICIRVINQVYQEICEQNCWNMMLLDLLWMKNRCKLFGVQTYKVPINIFQLLEIGMYFSLSLYVIMKNQISFNSQVGKMPNMDHKDDQNDSLVSISSLDFFLSFENFSLEFIRFLTFFSCTIR